MSERLTASEAVAKMRVADETRAARIQYLVDETVKCSHCEFRGTANEVTLHLMHNHVKVEVVDCEIASEPMLPVTREEINETIRLAVSVAREDARQDDFDTRKKIQALSQVIHDNKDAIEKLQEKHIIPISLQFPSNHSKEKPETPQNSHTAGGRRDAEPESGKRVPEKPVSSGHGNPRNDFHCSKCEFRGTYRKVHEHFNVVHRKLTPPVQE